jgi:hypothetical protein
MVSRPRHIVVLLAVAIHAFRPTASAQISPGELSTAHSALEGITSCTSCHELGKTASNERCLTCHTEIRTRINAQTGYHGSFAARRCAECHKEHNGKTFSLARFDTRTFDHSSIGFPLEGKHAPLECVSCHTRKHVKAQDILNDDKLRTSRTYLGLSQECRACHDDPHRGQLSARCQQCHTPETWKSPSRFSHDAAKFRLTGKHTLIECARCHPRTGTDVATIRFTGLSFSACSSCHADPHGGKFKKPCESCHATSGWKDGAARTFDHNTTKFSLRGKHSTVRCETCHVPAKGSGDGKSVQRFAVARFQKCSDCHSDPHRGEFAARKDKGACESCHTEKGFAPSTFLHSSVQFALQGRHEKVPCERCHSTRADRRPGAPPDFHIAKFRACADCHEDGHAGQFASRADRGACESCHTVQGYLPTKFTSADHQSSRFALNGSHVAVPCGACHASQSVRARSTRQFVWKEPAKCATCHRDLHAPQFSTAKYGGCESCHGVESWQTVRFVHDRTGFPLTGKHAGAACAACHAAPGGDTKKPSFRFAGTPKQCADCHTGKGQPAGKTQTRNSQPGEEG